LDEKTKEIVERLRKGSRAIWDGEKPIDFRPSGSDITEAADLITRLSARVEELERPPVANASACEDCSRPYSGHGFPDLIIPLAIWKQISTHGDETGLLCPSCLIARLDRSGLESVPAAFAGRAVESVTYGTMAALRESEDRALSKQGEGS
jgi:hypothetical protein